MKEYRKLKPNWTASDIPSQKNRAMIVTGTGGLAYEDALALARAGGDIVMAGRNPEKGAASIQKIRAAIPSAAIRFERLDLASLASIEAFGARMRGGLKQLDVLINNAAVMMPPQRLETRDKLELQFGTNYLGHFALTAQLLPLLRKGQNPRVINVCSIADRSGAIDFDDLQSERRYRPMTAYQQSKLASLIFSLELQRRSSARGWGISSIAAHPGISHTDLFHNAAGRFSILGITGTVLGPILFQPPALGALPTLFAATSPDAEGGEYYGPGRLNGIRGAPAAAPIAAAAKDTRIAARLWNVSERLAHVAFA